MVKAYLITIAMMSFFTIIVYGVDKIRSIKEMTRIPEQVLITLVAMGGVFGAIFSMIFFNHKSNMSRKWYFCMTLFLSFFIQIALFLMCAGIV